MDKNIIKDIRDNNHRALSRVIHQIINILSVKGLLMARKPHLKNQENTNLKV